MSDVTRFTPSAPCPICGGHDRMPRGQGERCHGYIGTDGSFAHCSREDLAGGLTREKGNTFAHRLAGPCQCGREHAPGAVRADPGHPGKGGPRGRIIATYDYRDAAGVLLFQAVRFKPKRFLQRRPIGTDKWAWNLDGVEPVPYRLPELLAADPAEPVFVGEGEKDVDRLRSAGLVASCNPMGAGKWRDAYSVPFRGRHAVVVPDNDQTGLDHAEEVARSLLPHAASVRVLDLAAACRALGLGELPEKGDAADFLEMGGTADDLRRLADEAPAIEPSGGGAPPGETQDQALIRLAADVDLFHSEDGTPFAVVPVHGRREALPLQNGKILLWLNGRYYAEHGRLPSNDAVQKSLMLLKYLATMERPCRPVAVRVAEERGPGPAAFLIDLADEEGRIVRVTADGWEVIGSDRASAAFRRPNGLRPLPAPERGGSVEELRRLVNLPDERQWRLLIGVVGAYLRPYGPYPVLVVNGEQGSAKTTLTRVVRKLIDPNAVLSRSESRDERDLMIAASVAWVQAFDNLDALPAWLANALCRLSTGGGFGTRALWTDDEEKIIEAMRPVVLNGIEDLSTRPDLLDRSVLLHLPAIPESARRQEREFWEEFERAWPRIFGALLDGVAGAMRIQPGLRTERLPRMADFAHWAECFGRALGWPAGAFLEAYGESIADATESALESSPVGAAVRRFMGDRRQWRGTASELLKELTELVGPEAAAAKGWPKQPNGLSGKLTRVAPALRKLGIDFQREEGSRKNGRALIITRLEPLGDDPEASGGRSRPGRPGRHPAEPKALF